MNVVPSSQSHVKETWSEERERDLFLSFLLLENQDEVRDFLLDILTEKEILIAAKRWCAVRGLLENGSREEIETWCQVHRNTVSNARKLVVKSGTGISKIIHQRLLVHKSENASCE